jgi:hypothetical protein
LNETYGLGTKYSLAVLFELLDQIADTDQLAAAHRTQIAEPDAPKPLK